MIKYIIVFVITYYGVSNLLLVLFLNYLKQKVIIKGKSKRCDEWKILNCKTLDNVYSSVGNVAGKRQSIRKFASLTFIRRIKFFI